MDACELLPKNFSHFNQNLSSHRIDTLCARCGECCRRGGPALHRDDLPLLGQSPGLALADLLTLRAGEPALDQPAGRLLPLAQEIVKLRGAGETWTCRFYRDEDHSCAIYEQRPLECRVLSCRDTGPLERIYDRDRITRRDLLPAGHPLLELLAEHERRCAVSRLGALLLSRAAEDREEVRAMLTWDREVRRLVPEKTGLSPETLPCLFGRPLDRLVPSLLAAQRRTP